MIEGLSKDGKSTIRLLIQLQCARWGLRLIRINACLAVVGGRLPDVCYHFATQLHGMEEYRATRECAALLLSPHFSGLSEPARYLKGWRLWNFKSGVDWGARQLREGGLIRFMVLCRGVAARSRARKQGPNVLLLQPTVQCKRFSESLN
jgi:hypothetical protein